VLGGVIHANSFLEYGLWVMQQRMIVGESQEICSMKMTRIANSKNSPFTTSQTISFASENHEN